MFKIHSGNSFCSPWERMRLVFTGKWLVFSWLTDELFQKAGCYFFKFFKIYFVGFFKGDTDQWYLQIAIFIIVCILYTSNFAFAETRILAMYPCSSAVATNSNAMSESVFHYVLFFVLLMSVNIKSGSRNWKLETVQTQDMKHCKSYAQL